MSSRSALSWLRSGNTRIPRGVRAARRGIARRRARITHGSVPSYMDAVVAECDPLVPAALDETGPDDRTHVVAVSTYPLHPKRSGGQLRGWHLLDSLAAHGGRPVSVVSLTVQPELAGTHEWGHGVVETAVALPEDHLRRDTALRLVTADVAVNDLSAALMWPGVPEFVAALRHELARACAVVLVQPYLQPAVAATAPWLPTVYDSHNDEIDLKADLLPDNSGGRWLLRHVEIVERAAATDAALVVATTRHDLEKLRHRYHIDAPAEVVPNGVDLDTVPFVAPSERRVRRERTAARLGIPTDRPVALFVGSGHQPNVDAGRRILALARRCPDVSFVLAGEHSTKIGGRNTPPNVQLLGQIDHDLLDQLLGSADVALNPVSVGGGSNLKLLEYLASGVPTVSSPIGARGLGVDDPGIFIAPEDHLDDALREALGTTDDARAAAGRAHVAANGNWAVVGERFARLVAGELQWAAR